MRIDDFGGEFKLIDAITRADGAVVGVGDDAAVLEYSKDIYQLFTTDMLCEGDHFRIDWASPYQIGVKAMEVNVSDIAACGGYPTYAVVSISLSEDIDVEFMKSLYEGMYSVCDRCDFKIIGGDTTHGKSATINVAMLGLVEHDMLRLRSDARRGQLICVSGDLGKSTAGLKTLLAGKSGYTEDHLMPRSRYPISREIARHASAMIDVSDGLASEVRHICESSDVGAIIYKDKIPISEKTISAGRELGMDPYDWALSGGEDFELCFTIDESSLENLDVELPITVVGKILEKKEGINLSSADGVSELRGGYDHFKK